MAIQGISGNVQQMPVPSHGQSPSVPAPNAGHAPPLSLQSPPDTVTISPTARNIPSANDSTATGVGASIAEGGAATASADCQTCQSRKYVDRSNDPSVSFQTPTALSPAAAESAVRAHEQEHVSHEQAKASENGQEVVFQSVAIHYGICPECGRSYVAGGTTTTVTKAEVSPGATLANALADAVRSGSVDLTV